MSVLIHRPFLCSTWVEPSGPSTAPTVLGVMVWDHDRAWAVPAPGQEDRVAESIMGIVAQRRGESLRDGLVYLLDRGCGGYTSVSRPTRVLGASPALAAASFCPEVAICPSGQAEVYGHSTHPVVLDIAQVVAGARSAGRSLYVDIAGEVDWRHHRLRFMLDPGHEREELGRVEGIDRLELVVGRDRVVLPSRSDAAVDLVLGRLDLALSPLLPPAGRWDDIAVLLRVLRATLIHVEGPAPLVVHTAFHGGWNAYYLVASLPLIDHDLVGLSEAGTVALVPGGLESGRLVEIARAQGVEQAAEVLGRWMPKSWTWPELLLEDAEMTASGPP